MGFRIVREPSADYIVKSGANYYAESDINLENILGTTTQDYTSTLFNLIYGKIIIDNVIYLVSTKDMQIVGNVANYNSIQNIDDIISLRYAYGNQDGYVIGKGNEVNIEQVDTKSVLIKSGRFVVQGVEVDIDANGITVDFDDVPQNSDVFVTVYAEVILVTNSVNVQKVFDTVDYPAVDKGDDLTHTINGTANIEIAHIKLSNGAIVSIDKTIKPIEYNLGITKDENGVLRGGDTIIPQKKLLWSGRVSATDTQSSNSPITFRENLANSGKTIEIISEARERIERQGQGGLVVYQPNPPVRLNLVDGAGSVVNDINILKDLHISFEYWDDYNTIRCFCKNTITVSGETKQVDYPCYITAVYEIIE